MDEEEELVLKVESDDDPVLEEIPVFLSKRLENQLYTFQFPLRPKNVDTGIKVMKCCLKPKNQEVKLEVKLDITSENFDTMRAETIAAVVDGKKEKDLVFENALMDKIMYTSSKVVKDGYRYAVGVLSGHEYHITPLQGLVQMKPCFEHFDKCVKRKRDMHNDSDEEVESTSKVEQVTVKFARGDNERWKNARENSYAAIIKKSADESWTECSWNDLNSDISKLERLKMFAENREMVHISKKLTAAEYIRKLVPEDREQAIIKPSLPSNVVSLHSLRSLPVLDQCRLLLKDAKIITYQQLLMLLAGGEGVTPDVLLGALPQVAVLVRGNWIVKSKVLYPKDTLSAVSGVPAETMCRARDYVLHLFTKNQYVERRKVSSVIKIPSEEIKEIFTGIAKLRYNKGWELKLPTDYDFLSKHSDIVNSETAQWDSRSKQLGEYFVDNKDKRQRRKSKSVSEDVKSTKKEKPSCSKDGAISSDTDSGTEKNKHSPVVSRKNKMKAVNGLVHIKDEIS